MREAVGLSLMVLVMGILRRLLFGRISRKMQYALWLSVPVFLVLSLFVRIPVTVRPLAGTESTEQIVSGNLQEAAGAAASEGMTAAATANEADSAQAEGMQDGMEIPAGREEIDRAGQAWPGESGTGFGWRLVNGTLRLGMRAAALLNTAGFAAFAGGIRAVGRGAAAALLLYNLFFALYCRRHRRLLGTDPETGLRVYRLRRTGSPFLLGRSVYVPSQTASDRELLYYAVLHEYCHFLQGDSLWPVVRHLILMMNWYNPLAWIAFRMAEQDSELACDERVLDRLGDGRRTEYGEVLIRKMRNRNTMPQFPCATTRMLGDRRRLRERITCISRRSARSVKLFAAGALCMVLVTGCALVSPGAPGTMTAEQTEAAEAQTAAGECASSYAYGMVRPVKQFLRGEGDGNEECEYGSVYGEKKQFCGQSAHGVEQLGLLRGGSHGGNSAEERRLYGGASASVRMGICGV